MTLFMGAVPIIGPNISKSAKINFSRTSTYHLLLNKLPYCVPVGVNEWVTCRLKVTKDIAHFFNQYLHVLLEMRKMVHMYVKSGHLCVQLDEESVAKRPYINVVANYRVRTRSVCIWYSTFYEIKACVHTVVRACFMYYAIALVWFQSHWLPNAFIQ